MTVNQKTKRIKRETYKTEEQTEIKHFIIILIIIIILILGVYFFTRIFVTKDLKKEEQSTRNTTGDINYNTTIIGSMLNKPDKEYFVLIYDSKSPEAVYYSGLISSYSRNKEPLPVYTSDTNNELNKKYIDKNNVNIETTNLEDLKIGSLALVKVANGKIEKIYGTETEITKTLEYVKDTKN